MDRFRQANECLMSLQKRQYNSQEQKACDRLPRHPHQQCAALRHRHWPVGKILLADRYTVRTHFIFELLQNAEDALARRTRWVGSRSVRFHLTERALRVSHFGRPFDDPDVRGICGIDESTKDLTAI